MDITEVYPPARINEVCQEYGLQRGSSLDLRSGWDFDDISHRNEAWKIIHAEKPFFIIGSPPCTMFSQRQALNPAVRGHDEEAVRQFREELGKARRHIEFCCSLYEFQMKRGAHFIHEHPWGAKSWNLECMRRLTHHDKVMIATVDL